MAIRMVLVRHLVAFAVVRLRMWVHGRWHKRYSSSMSIIILESFLIS